MALQWDLPVPTVVAVATTIAAVTAVVTTIVASVRRRRQHVRLIKEAVAALCAHQTGGHTPLRRMFLDLARVVATQEAQADRLAEVVRPRVPERPGKRNPITGVPVGPVLAEDIEAALRILAEADLPLPATHVPAPRRIPGPMRPVPRLDEATDLADLHAAISASVLAQVRRVRVVLAHGRRMRVLNAECHERIDSALIEVVTAERESGKLAAAGQLAEAVMVLAAAEMPVPEDGVPGEAGRRDVGQQTIRLRDVASVYRVELVAWCHEALARCGEAPGSDTPATTGTMGRDA